MRRSLILVLALALVSCATTPPRANSTESCLVHDDASKVIQCFYFVGETARELAPKTCQEMEGHPELVTTASCPETGAIGSCVTELGRPLETLERCYQDAAACADRCSQRKGRYFPLH